MKMIAVSLLLLFLFLSIPCVAYGSSSIEVDATGIVTGVTDGDTLDVKDVGTIRLADVDAPEYDEDYDDYQAAKDYLSSLIYNKLVYLDIDDVFGTDYNGTGYRLVCVVYVQHNATHFQNVNKALVNGGYAKITDFYNEFDPSDWALYYWIEPPPPPPEPIDLKVYVYKEATNEVISGATVSVYFYLNGSLAVEATTNTAGDAQFTLLEGDYYLTVHSVGYDDYDQLLFLTQDLEAYVPMIQPRQTVTGFDPLIIGIIGILIISMIAILFIRRRG